MTTGIASIFFITFTTLESLLYFEIFNTKSTIIKNIFMMTFHSHFEVFGYEKRLSARIISPLFGFWRRKNIIGEIIRFFLFYHLIFHYLNLTCKLSFIKSSPFSLYTSPKSCLDVDAVSYFVLLNKYSSK